MEMIFIFWLAFAIIVGVAANTRGRNGGGWFILAVLISPLIAGLLVLALPGGKRLGAAHAEEITIVQQRDIVSGKILAHRTVTPELLDLIAHRSAENLNPLQVISSLRDGKRVYTENSYFVRNER
jgi:hypothetical protein